MESVQAHILQREQMQTDNFKDLHKLSDPRVLNYIEIFLESIWVRWSDNKVEQKESTNYLIIAW